MELQIWGFTSFTDHRLRKLGMQTGWARQAGFCWNLFPVPYLDSTTFHSILHLSSFLPDKGRGIPSHHQWAMPWACLSILLHPLSISQPLQQHHCSFCLLPASSLAAKCSLALWKSIGFDLLLRGNLWAKSEAPDQGARLESCNSLPAWKRGTQPWHWGQGALVALAVLGDTGLDDFSGLSHPKWCHDFPQQAPNGHCWFPNSSGTRWSLSQKSQQINMKGR